MEIISSAEWSKIDYKNALRDYREVTCVALAHNSEVLHSRLEKLGFYQLKWTTNSKPGQVLIAMAGDHDVEQYENYNQKKTVTYKGTYWNAGDADFVRGKVSGYSNSIFCEDDEERFIELAGRIISEGALYVRK